MSSERLIKKTYNGEEWIIDARIIAQQESQQEFLLHSDFITYIKIYNSIEKFCPGIVFEFTDYGFHYSHIINQRGLSLIITIIQPAKNIEPENNETVTMSLNFIIDNVEIIESTRSEISYRLTRCPYIWI